MAVSYQKEFSNNFSNVLPYSCFSVLGEWMYLYGEGVFVWVNVIERKIPNEEPLKLEKSCYSHSPPDMALVVSAVGIFYR